MAAAFFGLGLLAGCGQRWPVSAQHAKAVVRTHISPEYQILKVTVARVTVNSRLAPGREVYPVRVVLANRNGELVQLWAVDAMTGDGIRPELSIINIPPADAPPAPPPPTPQGGASHSGKDDLHLNW